MRKMMAALVCTLALLAPWGCSWFGKGPQSSPERLMEAYLAAFQSRDFETMFSLTAAAVENEDELDHLISFIRMIELEDYRILQVEYLSDSEAVVEVDLTLRLMGQEKRHRDRIGLVSREGKWYLLEGIVE